MSHHITLFMMLVEQDTQMQVFSDICILYDIFLYKLIFPQNLQ
jgi:hypothetical protein